MLGFKNWLSHPDNIIALLGDRIECSKSRKKGSISYDTAFENANGISNIGADAFHRWHLGDL